jgi:hypothetical protein
MKDSRILREWVDAKGNQIKVNSTTTTSNESEKGNFNSKFTKLHNHINNVWGGVNIIRCTTQTLAMYYGYGQRWYHLIIRYIPEEGCFEINLSERQHNGKLIYAGEADSWTELLDILMQTETIKNRKLCEWTDNKGSKVSISNSTGVGQSEDIVYIWDMYLDPIDKGTWCSAEKINGIYDGFVFKSAYEAFRYGREHLYELDDEGELRGDPDDYDIDTVAIPKSEVSEYTLRFSGL